MRLCMFHPTDRPLDRGWVGRIDGDRVLHLAAQTLQSFFLGGGGAREHAEYPLAGVTLLVPVQHPPAVRIFERPDAFAFANPAAVLGPAATVAAPGAAALSLLPRIAAVVGAGETIAGFSLYAEWRDPSRPPPKDRDFAAVLGPVVVTPDELPGGAGTISLRVDGELRAEAAGGVEWEALRSLAADGTVLRPGDVLVAPAAAEVDGIAAGSVVQLELAPIGVLEATVAA